MPPPPLTHHQILALVEPFSRSGRQVDLAASDRLARRLLFKPRQLPADGACPALVETLQLDCHESGHHRLTRRLEPVEPPDAIAGASGDATGDAAIDASAEGTLRWPAATLETTGTDPTRLLLRVDAVPPARHFDTGPGWRLARSHALLPTAHGGEPVATFVRGEAQLHGLLLRLQVMDVKNVPGDLTLLPAPGERLALPEDVLAVIGWNWARLLPDGAGWTSKLRLRGRGPRRTAAAEQALQRAAQHLAAVLAAPPPQYHRQWQLARWGVVLRRGIPTLTALGLVAGAVLLPRATDPGLQGMWMALHYVPIGLLALSFTLQELARFEIPPLPRRLRVAQWRSRTPSAAT